MKAKRNFLALLLTVVMLWQGFSVVHAENTSSVATASNLPQSGLPEATGASPSGNGHERQDVITDVRMTLNDQPITGNTEIYADSVFALNVKLAVKNKAVTEGEYVELQLPSALSAKDENKELKAGNVTIANAHYDSGSKKLRITFTSDAANYSGADGEYKFLVRVNSSEVSSAQKIPMEIKVGGVSLFSLNMNYKGVGMDEEPNFWKNYGGDIETYVDKDGVKHFLIHFFIQINGRRIGTVSDKYTDVKIHDQLVSSVLTYVDPTYPELSMNWANPSDVDRFTPKLVRGVWKSGERDSAGFHPVADGAPRGHKWALQDLTNSSNPAPVRNIFSLSYKEGKRAFDYDLKDLNKEEGAELQYFVEVHELPKDGSKYYNDASLTANQIETKLHKREVTVQASEGRFDVKPYILRIEKKNKEGAPLSGAKFTIRDTKTNIEKTVVTGADGIATWDNALLSEYEIKEIEAPDGYVLNETPQTVSEEDLLRVSGEKKPMVTKTFINEKPGDADPETRTVGVEKEWIQGNSPAQRPGEVKVYLVENNVKTNKAVVLSEENGWKASFSDLPKKDQSGAEINYTVSEEKVQDYKPAISGTQDTGFTITNYTGDRVAIPVTKIWKGSGEHPRGIMILLFADRDRVSSFYLTKESGWQHTFVMPKFDSRGNEIKYMVTEEELPNYTASRADVEQDGYKNVFVNTKKENPNDPKPNDPKPSEPVPSNPGGSGNPRVPVGNTPGNPGDNGGTTPPPTTANNPGEVLGASRPGVNETVKPGEVLGVSRPAVRGRAAVATDDKSAMKLYAVLFMLSAVSFIGFSLYGKRNEKKRRRTK